MNIGRILFFENKTLLFKSSMIFENLLLNNFTHTERERERRACVCIILWKKRFFLLKFSFLLTNP